MLHATVATLTLLVIGYIIWINRRRWRVPRKNVIYLSVAFQLVGFALCAPQQANYLGHLCHSLTGRWHARDYVGHLCFIAAAAAMTYAVIIKLIPPEEKESKLRRIELPSAIAAAIMLLALFSSHRLTGTTPPQRDFFNVPLDTPLRIYWAIYWAILIYLIVYLIRVLLVLRREDPRSRFAANIYLTASGIGFVLVTAITADLQLGIHIARPALWIGLGTTTGLAAIAAARTVIKQRV